MDTALSSHHHHLIIIIIIILSSSYHPHHHHPHHIKMVWERRETRHDGQALPSILIITMSAISYCTNIILYLQCHDKDKDMKGTFMESQGTIDWVDTVETL